MSVNAAVANPIVIGHRGASGYVPEHTLTSYFIAIQQGADYIEPDLVMTKDGVLVARHENEIGGTTNVGEHPEFADRKTTKVIDGVSLEGWFTEDFTLAELKTLRARERIPQLRPGNTRFDGQFEVPTFDEVLAFVQSMNKLLRKKIGVYPETKHPTYFRGLSLAMEEPLLHSLKRAGYAGRNAPVFIQSFETANLRDLRKMTRLPLVFLMAPEGSPYGESRTYKDYLSPEGLKEIRRFANAIGVEKSLVLNTSLIPDAHAAGLKVHAWTFRAESRFIAAPFTDMRDEIKAHFAAGLDGIFTDQPDLGVEALRSR